MLPCTVTGSTLVGTFCFAQWFGMPYTEGLSCAVDVSILCWGHFLQYERADANITPWAYPPLWLQRVPATHLGHSLFHEVSRWHSYNVDMPCTMKRAGANHSLCAYPALFHYQVPVLHFQCFLHSESVSNIEAFPAMSSCRYLFYSRGMSSTMKGAGIGWHCGHTLLF